MSTIGLQSLVAGILSGFDASILFEPAFTMLAQLVFAMFLGMLLGIERNIAHQAAGMRTFGLVSMGACLFVLVSLGSVQQLSYMSVGPSTNDIYRVVEGVITGIGFLGAGIIIFKDTTLKGLTTAAGIWVAAGIGIAVAFELYLIATVGTGLTLLAFTFFWRVEHEVQTLVKGHKEYD